MTKRKTKKKSTGLTFQIFSEDQRFFDSGEGDVGLDDEELVDDVGEFPEPDFEQVWKKSADVNRDK